MKSLHSALFTTLLAITTSLAIEFPGPAATGLANEQPDGTGFTPKPTSPAELKARYLDWNALQRRQTIGRITYGYLEGSSEYPFTCDVGNAMTTNGNYWGCCSTDGNGLFKVPGCAAVADPFTSCIPYTSAANCLGDCFSYNRVCDVSTPFCAMGLFYTAAKTLTQYFCNSVPGVSILPILSTFTDVPGTTSPPSPVTTSIGPTTQPLTTITIPPTYTPGPVPPKSKVNIGAIAGGTVGGVVVIGAIIGLVALMMHNKKKAERKSALLEVSQVN